jgi:hypothetical protein
VLVHDLSLNGRDHLEDLVIGGKIILKWILGKSDLEVWIEFIWFRTGISVGLL